MPPQQHDDAAAASCLTSICTSQQVPIAPLQLAAFQQQRIIIMAPPGSNKNNNKKKKRKRVSEEEDVEEAAAPMEGVAARMEQAIVAAPTMEEAQKASATALEEAKKKMEEAQKAWEEANRPYTYEMESVILSVLRPAESKGDGRMPKKKLKRKVKKKLKDKFSKKVFKKALKELQESNMIVGGGEYYGINPFTVVYNTMKRRYHGDLLSRDDCIRYITEKNPGLAESSVDDIVTAMLEDGSMEEFEVKGETYCKLRGENLEDYVDTYSGDEDQQDDSDDSENEEGDDDNEGEMDSDGLHVASKSESNDSDGSTSALPIAVRLRGESMDGETTERRVNFKEEETTEDIDDEIARLERELAADDNDSYSDDDDDESDDDDHPDEQQQQPAVLSLSKFADDRVEHLPTAALPEPGKYDANGMPVRKMKKRKVDSSTKPSGLEQAVKEVLSGYQARSSERLPFYCRFCAKQYDNEEAFFAHKKQDFHKTAVQAERKATYCKLCRVQLTSPTQMKEHLKSRPHRDRLQMMKSKHQGGGRAPRMNHHHSNRHSHGHSAGRGGGRYTSERLRF